MICENFFSRGFRVKEEIWVSLPFFCTRCRLHFLGGKILREAILNFLPRMLLGEMLCKFFQIFPPKVLVYTGKVFLDTFLIKLIENHLIN